MKHALFLAIALAGCSSAVDKSLIECARSSDCDGNELCVVGTCKASVPQVPVVEDEPSIEPVPAVAGPCAGLEPPGPADLVINEVLANVPAEDGGDANGDGTRHAYEDEFIEVVNVSPAPLELGGGRLFVGETLKHTFEPVCLLPGDAIVVFGGGSVGMNVPGPAVIADRRLALPNDGGTLSITVGAYHEEVTYDRAPAASLTRTPELVGNAWSSHAELSQTAFSPGTCADGSAFSTACPSPLEADD